MTALKTCRDCGAEVVRTEDLANFVVNVSSKYGRQNLCKSCMAKKSSGWRLNNPERSLASQKRWALNNREKKNAHQRAYYWRNRETYRVKARAYYWSHRGPHVARRRFDSPYPPVIAPLCDCFILSEPLTVEELMERSGASEGYVRRILARYVVSGVVQELPDGRFRIDPASPLRFAMDGYFASRTASKEEVKL